MNTPAVATPTKVPEVLPLDPDGELEPPLELEEEPSVLVLEEEWDDGGGGEDLECCEIWGGGGERGLAEELANIGGERDGGGGDC